MSNIATRDTSSNTKINSISQTTVAPSSSPTGSSPPPPPSSTTAVTRSPVAQRPASPPGGRCCDTGRPIFTDPISGQTICSCQYELLSYGRLAAGGAPGGLPLSMYGAPPYPEGMAAYFPGLGGDGPPPFYSSAAGLELKENLAAGAGAWPYPSVYHPYDTAFAGYPFNGYGMDINGARRKNATRETTSTLKAWLNEHKKNPYPTKGEKIMLAIITKMTLTQVSTWFANARRRLKKENKMTWEPRNRVEDEDNNNDDASDGRKSADPKDHLDSKDSGTGSSEDGDRPPNHRLDLLDRPGGAVDTGSEWSESRPDSGPDSPECLFERPQHFLHPAYHGLHHPHARFQSSPPPSLGLGATTSPVNVNKPRIWSLADMASKENDIRSSLPSSVFSSGKMISPLAGRPHHLPHPNSYRHDLYRLYGSHLGAHPGSTEFLEQYQRHISSLSSNNPNSSSLAAVVAAAAAASSGGGSSTTPFGLAVTAGASSASSSGSSVSESPGLHNNNNNSNSSVNKSVDNAQRA